MLDGRVIMKVQPELADDFESTRAAVGSQLPNWLIDPTTLIVSPVPVDAVSKKVIETIFPGAAGVLVVEVAVEVSDEEAVDETETLVTLDEVQVSLSDKKLIGMTEDIRSRTK